MSSSSDEVVVVRVQPDPPGCTLILADGASTAEFLVRFEDVRGIRLMKESDALTRWCMDRGRLWALGPLFELANAAVQGGHSAVPVRLMDPRTKAERGR